MKASQLIEHLQKLIEYNGDLTVVTHYDDDYYVVQHPAVIELENEFYIEIC